MDSLELMTITLMMLRASNLTTTSWFLVWLPFIISLIIRFFKWGYNEHMGSDEQVLITNLDLKDLDLGDEDKDDR